MNKEVLIRLSGISKSFDGETVLDNMDLEIHDKEFITLLGPSGCGKTTTLRIIGGFETPDTGDVFFDGERINDLPPYKRQVNTVFQRYALFPHLNVFDNIAFGLRVRKTPAEEIRAKVKDMLALVNLRGFEKRKVSTLSGGQQQRVAIARALVNNPAMIIADEPTGNLDPQRSYEIMMLLERINALGTTVMVVTHERELVNRFTKRVIAISEGRVINDGMDGYYVDEET